MEFSHITIQGARYTTSATFHSKSRATGLLSLPGSAAQENPASPSTPSTPKAEALHGDPLPLCTPVHRQHRTPDVDFIEGLSPVIAIDQKSTSRSPRSTVGTITEIHDFVRLLFAKAGRRYDPVTGQMLQKQSEESIVDSIMALEEGTKIQILSPLVTGRKGHYRELFERLMLKGWLRVRVDGKYRELEKNMQLERYKTHTIDLVVDRLALAPDLRERITKAVALAIANSEHRSTLSCDPLDPEMKEMVFSTRYAYSDGSVPVDTLAPNHFSFNSPFGACPECNGIGELMQLSAQLILPDPTRSLNEGGLDPLGKPGKRNIWQIIRAIAREYSFNLDTPIADIPDEAIEILLHGSGSRAFDVTYSNSGLDTSYPQKFPGAIPYVEEISSNASTPKIREWAESYMVRMPCPECGGARLRRESLLVKINGLNIAETESLPLQECLDFFSTLEGGLSAKEKLVAEPVLHEITKRLRFLLNVGLDYLTLDRGSQTLSGGEAQRIRLASQLGSQLSGVLYVLDEPSIGLHQRDNHKLIASLLRLRDLGNTVLVVEHDRDTMLQPTKSSTWARSWRVWRKNRHSGTADALDPRSLTAGYLSGSLKVACAAEPEQKKAPEHSLNLTGCTGNNLKEVDLRIPSAPSSASQVSAAQANRPSSTKPSTLYSPATSTDPNSSPTPTKQLKGLNTSIKSLA